VPNSPGTTASTSVGEVASQAQDAVSQVTQQAQTTAGQVTHQAKQQATSQLESQKTRAVDSLVTVAQALRQTGQQLHEQDQGAVGGYVEQAAERVEGLTNYLRARDVPQLIRETQDFARREPGLFLTGAVALGFIGARFLMSSGQRASRQSSYASGGATYPYPSGQTGSYPAAGGGVYPAGTGVASAGMPRYPSSGGTLPGMTGSTYDTGRIPANSGEAPAMDTPDVTRPDRPGSLPGSLEA
jgi:hypothetical protein